MTVRSAAIAALSLLLTACDSSPRRMNVILVVVDTLRADRLGCYGAQRDTSPCADSLAARSTRFARAYAAAPWTNPSVASILTGLYPGAHAVTRPGVVLPQEVETVAEVLRDRGWVTAGFVSNGHLGEKWGFDQGFELYREDEAKGYTHVSSEGITRQASEALRAMMAGDRPFFLFALYFDPHYAYMRHPDVGFAKPVEGGLEGGEPIGDLRRMSKKFGPTEIGFVRDLYDEEIRHTDDSIARLLRTLVEGGHADDTVIVLTADHGEEFLERGWIGHVRTLYDELVRVPLLVHDPRRPEPVVVDSPVSLVSLAGTILELAGADVSGFPGGSLVPLLDGDDASEPDPVFCEVDFVPVRSTNRRKEAHKKAVVAGHHKLVRDDVTGRIELYDLRADTTETRDLAREQPARTERLVELLDDWVERTAADALEAVPAEITDEELEVMRGLGYVD